jgi:hypothetical protein
MTGYSAKDRATIISVVNRYGWFDEPELTEENFDAVMAEAEKDLGHDMGPAGMPGHTGVAAMLTVLHGLAGEFPPDLLESGPDDPVPDF